MSEVEEDLEFYTAFEDELYKENGSDYSDDEINSELEAELYQNVHFASSLVVTPSEENHGNKDHDDDDNSSLIDSFDEKTASVDQEDGKPVDSVDGIRSPSTNKYPEVKLVFSNEKKKSRNSKCKTEAATLLNVVQSTDGDEDGNENSLTANEGWELDEADLLPAVISREKKRKSTSRIRCLNCHERGHRTFECPQPTKETVCYLCGMAGHVKKDCPNELCFNCNEPGHQSRRCRKARCRPGDTCRRCHAYGHFESLCPDKWRQYRYTIKQGDIVQGVTPLSKTLQNEVYCYNCGNQGHFGHECLEDREDGRVTASFPFVVKYDRFTTCPPRVDENIKHWHKSSHFSQRQYRQQDHRTQTKNKRKGLFSGDNKRSKRRKVEDNGGFEHHRLDHGWEYSRDNWNTMEEQHAGGELPRNCSLDNWVNGVVAETAAPTTGFEGKFNPNRGKKRKKKRKKLKVENIQVTTTRDNIGDEGNKSKKIKRKIQLEPHNENFRRNGCFDSALQEKKNKKRKKKKKKKPKNEQLSHDRPNSTAPALFADVRLVSANVNRPGFQEGYLAEHKSERRTGLKRPRKKTKKQPPGAQSSRKVFFDFNGFV